MPNLVDDSVVVRRGDPHGGPTRSDTWRATVSLNGENLGVWDKVTGGAIDSEELKFKPGGMAPQVSLGGSKTNENVTLQRLYRLVRDHNHLQKLINAVGRGSVVVSKQPLDVDGNPFGRPIVYKGILKRVTPPEHDSESNSPAMLEIEVSTSGTPHVG
jgi:hypothetical protein